MSALKRAAVADDGDHFAFVPAGNSLKSEPHSPGKGWITLTSERLSFAGEKAA